MSRRDKEDFARSCGAREVVISTDGAPAAVVRDIDALTAKSIRLSRPNYFDYLGDASSFRRHAESLFAMLEQGKVKISIDERFGFTAARQAHERIESRSTCGSLVITV